jgi:hypothetical protein
MPKSMLLLSLLVISLAAGAEDTLSTQVAVPAIPAATDEQSGDNDNDTCDAKWERYFKSQECFAPYRNANGSLKPGAYENCTEVKKPTECPLQSPK